METRSVVAGYCTTNLDEYRREEWPKHFVAVPRVGERVESKSGKSLRVVGVTHAIHDGTPKIRVELNR